MTWCEVPSHIEGFAWTGLKPVKPPLCKGRAARRGPPSTGTFRHPWRRAGGPIPSGSPLRVELAADPAEGSQELAQTVWPAYALFYAQRILAQSEAWPATNTARSRHKPTPCAIFQRYKHIYINNLQE